MLIYGVGLGIEGSAWGTVIAQVGAALVFLAIVRRTAVTAGASLAPHTARIRAAAVVGSQLVVRTASLLLALLTATAVAARIGDADVAAHQIAFQIWWFFALALDAIAIAGQAMIGRFLGAEHAHDARAAARRMLEWGLVGGLLVGALVAALRPVLVPIFTSDTRVRHLAFEVLWIVALMQPINAIVFVLDGILIGAGDAGYLAAAMAVATLVVFLPLAAGVLAADGTLLMLWGALALWMVARLAGLVAALRIDTMAGDRRGESAAASRQTNGLTGGAPSISSRRMETAWRPMSSSVVTRNRFMPSAANRSAIAYPIPLAAPVMTATLSRRSSISCSQRCAWQFHDPTHGHAS